jgi:hypothetical protein
VIGWQREAFELINEGHFRITDAGPLHAPINSFSIQRNQKLELILETRASGMARLGIGLPVIEKVLNHTSGSFAGIVGVYQRHDFKAEKRAALDAWGRHVALVSGETGNIVELVRA